MTTDASVLTSNDIEHFLEHGWVKLSNCFTKEQAHDITKDVWTRLGISEPDSKKAWDAALTARGARDGWINMPDHRTFAVKDFAPKAWKAIGELVVPGALSSKGASARS